MTSGGRRLLTGVAGLALVLGLAGCGETSSASSSVGDPGRGRDQFEAHNCGSCHRVSGMSGTQGRAGPDLDGLVDQRMIAGVLPMTPEFLAAWIQDPPAYSPETGMPDVGVGEQDARDIAAWLLSR